MIEHFCNQCKQPVTRNMVTDPLLVESGIFKIQVMVTPFDPSGDEDLCMDCMLKALNAKPKRKYVRKETTQITESSLPK